MMLDHLRHILIPLSAGLLLFSCTAEEPAISGNEMKFDISAISRANVTTAQNITGQPFALFGDMTPTQLAASPSARTIVYDNTPVTYLNSAWRTPSPQYWYNNHEHSFVAIHPASVVTATEANSKYLNSQHSFTYTLPSSHKEVADILVATHRRNYTDQREYDEKGNLLQGSADVVYLRFGHIMSRINLAPAFSDNIMSKDAYIRFYKIEMTGFKTKCMFKLRPASLLTAVQTDDKEIEITDREGSGELTIEFPEPKVVKNEGNYVSLMGEDDSIIMIPQSFAVDSDAKIIFTYSSNDETQMRKATLNLNGQEWMSGKNYNYRFTIDRVGLISDTTNITDWDVSNVGNIDAH